MDTMMLGKQVMLVPIDEGVQYVANDERNNNGSTGHGDSLQIMLHPMRVLNVDHNSICWTSDGLTFVDTSPFARWVGRDKVLASDRVAVSNQGMLPLCLTLSQNEGSSILSVKVASKTIGLMCFKDSYLCSTSQLAVDEKGFPLVSSLIRMFMVLPNEMFRLSLNKTPTTTTTAPTPAATQEECGYVFLQTRNQIMHKRLLANETFHVRSDCLVAYQESCKLTFSTASLALRYGGGSSSFLKFEGPGIVYFCTQTARRSNRANAVARDSRPVTLATMLLAISLVAMIILSRFVDIQILEEMPEN